MPSGKVSGLLQFSQRQVGCDDHRLFAPIAAVDYVEYLLQGKFRAALHTEIVQHQQTVVFKAVNETVPVLRIHPGQRVQNTGEICHQDGDAALDQGVGDTSSKEGFACADIAPKQQSR